MDWSPKWKRHGWRTASGEVGHRDLWEAITEMRELGGGGGGGQICQEWTPSHVKVPGNEGTDQLAEAGRLQHLNNKRHRTEPEWEVLGLYPTDSGASSTDGEGTGRRSESSEFPWSLRSVGREPHMEDTDHSAFTDTSSESLSSDSGSGGSLFSTDVSDTTRKGARYSYRESRRPCLTSDWY